MIDAKVMPEIKLTAKSYEGEREVTWCPGCGDFGILNAV